MLSISILIPTFNSEKTIKDCLNSIYSQDYPNELMEIIIADPGSTDATRAIAGCFGNSIKLSIVPNFLQTGEAGKASALRYATGDIVALIDSDNILPETNWITRMIAPFSDNEIVGTEPIMYTCRKEDGFITRYCALIGMNDPLCNFLGNYDRYNNITGKWTEMPVTVEKNDDYLKVSLNEKHLPTIGANGFLIRKDALLTCSVEEYLFDIDVLWEILTSNYRFHGSECKKIAKVNIGIVHIFSGNISTFVRKQKRRIKDFTYFKNKNIRKYPWGSVSKLKLLRFILYSTSVFPLLFQMVKGFNRQSDSAWLFHPVACVLTLWIYVWGTIVGKISPAQFDRKSWSQ